MADKRYTITVITGTRRFADTRAKVYITVNGTLGSSPETQLEGEFGLGSTREFTFEFPDLGSLKTVDVRQDDSGTAPAWFLGKILVKDNTTNATWVFPADEWLSDTATHTLVGELMQSGGTIYYSADQIHALNSDPTGTVTDVSDVVVTTSYVYALTLSGAWFVKAGADAVNPYRQISGVPKVDSVWGGTASDYGYAISGGKVYGAAANTDGFEVSDASGVISLATTGGRTFALDSQGHVYRILDGEKAFHQVMLGTDPTTPLSDVTAIDGNQGGGYGWAIAGTDIYFMLDNNLAYLSTTTEKKPSNPVFLSIGASWAYVLDEDGSVWSHYAAAPGDWTRLVGLPGKATFLTSQLGTDYVWAMSEGAPYWAYYTNGFASANAGSLAGSITQLWVGANYAYVRTKAGQWWRSNQPSTTAQWGQITGTPRNTVHKIATNWGNFAWAIADRDIADPA
ncbi:PLAT/LH2 domain-containing protein [Intrasporangium sp.]|uniref:PLAT/LH2 domain-containing protein n=1 Tax=Intrasporangium sp. TaxID=1925024 RepID=UPI0032219624